MNNTEFLSCILESFKTFLATHSRSNQKLVILHGCIANDLALKLGEEYQVKSLGYGDGKEAKIEGRYLLKNVDITILKDGEPIAGVAIKFVMQNYSQNSVNYFENMLGETANIRSNGVPYFQIFIIPDKLPYYKKGGEFQNWEDFSHHNVEKYIVLSRDSIERFFHSPTKTLLFVVNLPEIEQSIRNKEDYILYYQHLPNFTIRTTEIDYGRFDNSVIFNDYETYIEKVVHYIKSI